MQTFLFYASSLPNEVTPILQGAARVLESLDLNGIAKAECAVTDFKNGFGWMISRPAGSVPNNPTITDYQTEEYAVLATGTPYRNEGNPTNAELIAEAYRANGVSAVQELDVQFSAVLVDHRHRKAFFLTDHLRMVQLKYYRQNGRIWVSNQEASIVAGSKCDISIDPISIYSMLRTKWSIGGQSMFKSVDTFAADKRFYWQDNELSFTPNNIFSDLQRTAKGDRAGVKRVIDEMIDVATKNVARMIDGRKEVYLDLTAGMDTRAVVALLQATRKHQICIAGTRDSTAFFEMATAKWLAKTYHLEHFGFPPELRPVEDVSKRIEANTFYSNGMAPSFRAFKMAQFGNDHLRLTGHQAGFTKGFYYGSAISPNNVEKNIFNKVLSKKLPLENFDYEEQVALRIQSSIQMTKDISKDPYDQLDLFYLYERNARWGPANSVIFYPWASPLRYCFFESPALMRVAAKLPAPMSQNYLFHRTLIKKYIPKSYYRLVNARDFMPVQDSKWIFSAIRTAAMVRRKFVGIYKSNLQGFPQVAIFIDRMRDQLEQSINTQSGPLAQTFTQDQMRKLIAMDVANDDQIVQYGNYISMETYHRTITQIVKLRNQ